MDKSQKQTAKNILIVDDTPDNLRLLSEILTEQGYRIRVAQNGARALATVQIELPDLILLDISMPDMDGYEVCQHLKASEQTRDIPVIFISARDETEDKVKGFTMGGVDYVTKPFQIEEVLARVNAHLTIRNLQKQLQEKNVQLHSKNEQLQEKNAQLQEALDNIKNS